MHDGSSTERASAAKALGTGIRDEVDSAVTKVLTVPGYCAECGTWDAHGLVCSACGCDFGGSATD